MHAYWPSAPRLLYTDRSTSPIQRCTYNKAVLLACYPLQPGGQGVATVYFLWGGIDYDDGSFAGQFGLDFPANSLDKNGEIVTARKHVTQTNGSGP